MPERVANGREKRYNQRSQEKQALESEQQMSNNTNNRQQPQAKPQPPNQVVVLVEGATELVPGSRRSNDDNHHQTTTSSFSGPKISDPSRAPPSPSQSRGRSSASASGRAKFIKSKSSPSSLTTHKFGLRPTPSPPRLIIDHQTGDIVERYPENPTFLRTYQPIEDNYTAATTTTADLSDADDDDDTTQNQIDDSFASILTSQPSANQPTPIKDNSKQQRQQQQQQDIQMGDFNQHTNTSSRPNQQPYQHAHQPTRPHPPHAGPQPVIPPPHSGKVYFAPPVTSNNLFEPQLQQQQQQQQLLANQSNHTSRHAPQFAQAGPYLAPNVVPSAAVRRALSSLSDNERTDIAILTEPDDAYEAHEAPQMKITATSASKASALLAKQQPPPRVISTNASKLYGQPAHSRSPSLRSGSSGHGGGSANSIGAHATANGTTRQQQQQQMRLKRQQTLAAVEDFDLYNFCFNLRILMGLAISALIIYLLLWPLNVDCVKFRPTYAHFSLTIASVNLIAIIIFSLFWYCTSIGRTLYQDLSSSAFIVTTYSILVCLNLTMCIVFFFINTCHTQKLLATHSALADLAGAHQGNPHNSANHLPLLLTADDLIKQQQPDDQYQKLRRHQLDEILESIESAQVHEFSDRTQSSTSEHSKRVRRHWLSNDDRAESVGPALAEDGDGATVIDDQLGQQPPQQMMITTTSTSTAAPASDFFNQDHASGYTDVPEVSPIEAFWAWLKEQAHAFKRLFRRFLLNYDLKFVGALHAICAACFQYLAIKVAVVRSFYRAPAHVYA